MRRLVAIAPVLAMLACGGSGTERPASGHAAADVPELGEDVRTFDARVAVFMFADTLMLDSLRAVHGDDDFYVIADDMMYYRAEAIAWLEDHGIPIVDVQGRPPVAFEVEGEPAPFAFSADHPLDLVVLYQPGQAPVAVAPIDVPMTAPTYFGVPASAAPSP